MIQKQNQTMNEKKESRKEFTIIERVNSKYFTEIESSVLHFQQTLFDLQNECYKSWKNAVKANVSLQKEFAEKSGYNFELAKTAQIILEDIGDEITKYRLASNQMAIKTIESGKKNIKIWNDNAETFVELNRKIMGYWLTLFIPK
jgi:hypothetical protein